MAFTIPTVANFQSRFNRDFAYGNSDLTTVQDVDIQNALNDAGFNFNQDFFPDQGSFNTGYLLLAAHFLVVNLRASSQGLSGGSAWLTQSKSVGPISESYAIPQYILDNPVLSLYAQTPYGTRYLQYILPFLAGNIFTVYGGTNA